MSEKKEKRDRYCVSIPAPQGEEAARLVNELIDALPADTYGRLPDAGRVVALAIRELHARTIRVEMGPKEVDQP